MGDAVTLSGYRPGAIGRITWLHGDYYGRHWGFGLYFEAKVARELADFLGRFDGERDLFRLAVVDDAIAGSIAIDGAKAAREGAHLRWFIVDPQRQGLGLGRLLLDDALGFCAACGYARVFLWTFAGLDAARRLYEAAGFRLVEEIEQQQWGKRMREQRFELAL